MYKYANRDWPWCDPRLQEYMDKYCAIHKGFEPWPSSKGMQLEEWRKVIDDHTDRKLAWIACEEKKLFDEYKDLIAQIERESKLDGKL
jgi:hypothetical protein